MKSILTFVFALTLFSQAAHAVPVAHGDALALYDPLTGQVLISSNGADFIEVSSSLGQLIPANAISPNSIYPGMTFPNAVFMDEATTSRINYFTFVFPGLGVGGILDDFSIGAILPTGIGPIGGTVPNAQLRWHISGEETPIGPIRIIPEPSSFILAGIASIGLFVVARRQRAS